MTPARDKFVGMFIAGNTGFVANKKIFAEN
jgi:hypothetical protein